MEVASVLRVLLVGPPGAGKGTQAALLASAAAVPHLSTGEMFRQAVAHGTPTGERVRALLDQGALVSDDVTVGVVREQLSSADCERGFVLDGFPRTIPQALALDEMLLDLGLVLDAAVALTVPREVLVARLTGRRVCPQCGGVYQLAGGSPGVEAACPRCGTVLVTRDDDRPEVQARRLEVYWRETAPLLEYYARDGRLVAVDGDQPVEKVASSLKAAIDGRMRR